MQFLVDASLPRSVATLIRQLGHDATDVRDIGFRLAHDPQIASHAQANHLALITADSDFADIRIYPPENYHGIIFIDRPEDAKIADVLDMIRSFFARFQPWAALPTRLVVVRPNRIRIRPPLPDIHSSQ